MSSIPHKIPAFVDREPLYDLNGALLGHSCRAVVASVYVQEYPDETSEALGIKSPRGFEAVLNPREREYHIEWFEPFITYTPW